MNAMPMPRTQLLWTTLSRFVGGFVFIAALLFWPAGTLDYWQAWLYLAILFVPVAFVGVVLFLRDPALLERRLRTRETESAQRKAILFSSLLLLTIFLVPGFDRRYGWSTVPVAVIVLADILILAGYLLFALTIRENRYASRVVEVAAGQTVISSGPYALVRHPMYLAVVLMFGATPVALGSWWGLLPALLLPVALAGRIKNEEAVLGKGLVGYDAYQRQVKYRLIPFVW